MKERKLLYSAIKTPDGTILSSRHRHDFVTHIDKNGDRYFLDGGNDYVRKSINIIEAEDISVYDDEPHEKIRETVSRGTHGIRGDAPLQYVLIKDIEDDWLNNIILYEQKNRPNNPYLKIYLVEKEFRKQR